MSQTQYKQLMSNLLKEKHTLAKLRAKLEERRGKLCWYCKGFRHLAHNCRKEKEEEGKPVPHNKFEVLASRVMRCGVEIRRKKVKEMVEKIVCYFKCRKKEHCCRECP